MKHAGWLCVAVWSTHVQVMHLHQGQQLGASHADSKAVPGYVAVPYPAIDKNAFCLQRVTLSLQ